MNHNLQPLVSIVVPAYNIEKYISQTLESIIGQTYENIEIIVVDDGSTDTTLHAIHEYAKKDARLVVFSQANKGLSAARNAGFRLAKGEYLCIIDADDIMMPEKVEQQLCFLQAHPSADFTYSKVRYFVNETHQLCIRDMPTPEGQEVHSELLKKGNLISPNSVFFRKSVFDTVGGFDESLRSAEDLDYWLFLSGKGVNFLHQDQYLTLCRMRQDSLTADSVTMYSSVVRVFEKHLPASFWSRITSSQLIKNKFLLQLAYMRRPALRANSAPSASVNRSFFSKLLNRAYLSLRRLKFSYVFKKIYDSKVQEYLLMIESSKKI